MASSLGLYALVAAAAVAFLAIRSMASSYAARRRARQLGCGRPGSLPTGPFGLGALVAMLGAGKRRTTPRDAQRNFELYGHTYQVKFPGGRVLDTDEPENIKALLATQFADFGLGLKNTLFRPLLGDGIFTLDGAGWAHARALLRPQFAKAEISDLATLERHVRKLIRLILAGPADLADVKLLGDVKLAAGVTAEVQALFYRFTLDSATEFLFGESMGSLDSPLGGAGADTDERGTGFASAFNEAQQWMQARIRSRTLYWLLAESSRGRAAVKTVHGVTDFYVQKALQLHHQTQSRSQSQSQSQSQADDKNRPSSDRYIFLEALAADTQDPIKLRDNMLNILLAGRDTTAGLLSSTLLLLARHPRVWHKLRGLVLDEFGDVNAANPTNPSKAPETYAVTRERLQSLTYLRHVLNEALRLYPSVPLNFRTAARDTTLPRGGGAAGRQPVLVRKGDMVIFSTHALHRRQDIWGADAEEFRPERWSEPSVPRGWEYLPFSGGPRICLGQQYALTQASYTLVRLMQQFERLESADERPFPTPVNVALTLVHTGGVSITFFPVQPQPQP